MSRCISSYIISEIISILRIIKNFDPLLHTWITVLDRCNIRTCTAAITYSCYKYIKIPIECDCIWNILTAGDPTITSHPLLDSRGIIFDSQIIQIACGIRILTRYVNISKGINYYIITRVVTVRRSGRYPD